MPVCSLAAAADGTMRCRQRPAMSCIDGNVILRREGVEAGFVTGRNCRLK
jgi:hypothetical protein